MKSVMTNRFAVTPNVDIPRSTFTRSHGHKTTIDVDYLYPVYVDEALPGDTFEMKMTAFARLNTPIYPIMDNMVMESFFFEIPMRIVWDNFRKMMGERYPNPDSSIDYSVPTATSTASDYDPGQLSDYMGIPTKVAGLEYSNLWHRAYNLCWNEWFRDQNLQNSVTVDTDDGPDTPTDYVLLKANKRHDYFTSALPWPQRETATSFLTGEVPVKGIAVDSLTWASGSQAGYEYDGASTYSNWKTFNAAGADNTMYVERRSGNSYPNIHVDFADATLNTINSLREAFQIQRLLERDARGGTRYTEINRSHFGVTSPDGRAWRPVYLGGGRSFVNISPIAQTSSTDVTSPQGNLAALGTGVMSGSEHGFSKSFTEHSLILGLVCVRADLTYQQGMERMFNRRTRYDFYWPALAQIGEQAILNKEIYANGTSSEDEATFGYNQRYDEYRYKPSRISGIMRSNATTPLDAWHLSEQFSTRPSLNSTFIQSNTPIDRVVAVTTEPDFLFDSYFDLKCTRPMPLFGIPGMMDHF